MKLGVQSLCVRFGVLELLETMRRQYVLSLVGTRKRILMRMVDSLL